MMGEEESNLSMAAIQDRDIAFARAVVGLARQHGMTSVTMEYRHSFSTALGSAEYAMRRLSWAEGRHESKAAIKFRLEAERTFSEE